MREPYLTQRVMFDSCKKFGLTWVGLLATFAARLLAHCVEALVVAVVDILGTVLIRVLAIVCLTSVSPSQNCTARKNVLEVVRLH